MTLDTLAVQRSRRVVGARPGAIRTVWTSIRQTRGRGRAFHPPMRMLIGLLALIAGATTAAAAPSCPKVKTHGAFCFRGDAAELQRFEVCGNTALLCTGGDFEGGCAAVDLTTGKFQHAVAAARQPRARVTVKGTAVSLCVGARCVVTDLPASEMPYAIDLSGDGKHAAVTVDLLGSEVVVLDTATGKRTRTVKLPTRPSDEVGPAYFLGSQLFVLVGQWPIERGFLIEPGGATRALDDNFGRGKPFALGRQRWAIPSFGGGEVIVVDARTGALTRSPPIPDTTRACHDCFLNSQDPGLDASRLGLTAGGKLVLINVAGLRLVDPRTLATIRNIPLPICVQPRP